MTSIDDEVATTYAVDSVMPKRRAKDKVSTLSIMVSVRLTSKDADRLEALSARIPVASRHAIAREALRLGLEILERDPARLVGNPSRGRKR